jgi:2-haloacid dehalogenase
MFFWDAVISCEMHKPRPETYRQAAKFLQLGPGVIMMVACHNFDLDAARSVGSRTCFVRHPDEWGPAGPPDLIPNPASDLTVDSFVHLVERMGT